MIFIADVMLGRLAKRLRLLGIDVLYDNTLGDNAIISIALQQNRIILTRDTGLAARPLAANHLFITSNRVQEQVRQVLDAYPFTALPLTRCSECNELLAPIDKSEVLDVVPPYVYQTIREFHRCAGCGRIYWEGTHVDRMGKTGMAHINKRNQKG
jgi:uncharacterized protein with PIN domain